MRVIIILSERQGAFLNRMVEMYKASNRSKATPNKLIGALIDMWQSEVEGDAAVDKNTFLEDLEEWKSREMAETLSQIVEKLKGRGVKL